MRQTCLNMVYELAKADDRVVFIGSDLGAGTLDNYRREMPDRFFMEGVSEANVVGMAAGLALEGHVVYVNTLAVFLTRRALEQVSIDLCLHNLDVRLIGNGGGLVYAPLGPTHMAVDDFALMRPLPNMAIVAPADADEMRRIMPLVHARRGPVYVRLGKGNDPIVTPADERLAFGEAVSMREGNDALLVTTGVMLKVALEAADLLSAKGRHVTVLHCPTVKPLDEDAILSAAGRAGLVVTIEEHLRTGGLGSAVAELVAERAPRGVRLHRVSMPDAYPDRYGSQAELFAYYGLTADRVAAAVENDHAVD